MGGDSKDLPPRVFRDCNVEMTTGTEAVGAALFLRPVTVPTPIPPSWCPPNSHGCCLARPSARRMPGGTTAGNGSPQLLRERAYTVPPSPRPRYTIASSASDPCHVDRST